MCQHSDKIITAIRKTMRLSRFRHRRLNRLYSETWERRLSALNFTEAQRMLRKVLDRMKVRSIVRVYEHGVFSASDHVLFHVGLHLLDHGVNRLPIVRNLMDACQKAQRRVLAEYDDTDEEDEDEEEEDDNDSGNDSDMDSADRVAENMDAEALEIDPFDRDSPESPNPIDVNVHEVNERDDDTDSDISDIVSDMGDESVE